MDNIYDLISDIKKEQVAARANNVIPKVREILNDAIQNTIYPEVRTMIADNLNETIYPVGSIISTFDNVNPGQRSGSGKLPGTWVQFGQGRVMVGVNSSDSDFNSAGKTGGAKTQTLTVNQMPKHTHTFTTDSAGGDDIPLAVSSSNAVASGSDIKKLQSSSTTKMTKVASLPEHTHDGTTDETGNDEAFNNMPPYITAYFWRRTA